MSVFDFKKEYKELYLPKNKPCIIDVPKMRFIMVDGKGDPNTSASYKEAVEVLYGLSYSIKMSKKSGTQPEGYFDYVLPPLEGLWWFEGEHFDERLLNHRGTAQRCPECGNTMKFTLAIRVKLHRRS